MKTTVKSIIVVLLCLSIAFPVYALDGIWHNPYGIEDLYDVQQTERAPRDPIAGDTVHIKGTTWPVEFGQNVWLSYSRNGIPQPDVGSTWTHNEGNNSYWDVSIGPFAKGDVITYCLHANVNGQNQKNIGPFSFTVLDWESVQSVSLASSANGLVTLNAQPNTGTFSPQIGLSFLNSKTVHLEFSPKGNASFSEGASVYSVSENSDSITILTSALRVSITKSPYSIQVFDIENNHNLIQNGGTGSELCWLTDGVNMVARLKDGYLSPTSEDFYGFGERYDSISQRGNIVNTYVYNQYRNQNDRTYLAVPFFCSSNGYGIFLNSTCYSKFDMASTNSQQYSFAVESDGSDDPLLDYYLIAGNPDDVISQYSEIAGKPQEMPKWAFGLWMSANEWDRQSEVLTAVNCANVYDIPATAVVLEQWSDENTFYIFNESTYIPVAGANSLSYQDFSFSAKWPDPRSMADTIHGNNMKLILWQVPVLKYTTYPWAQKDNDEAYMLAQGYAVEDGNSGAYRTPSDSWFGNSLLLDFTNENAVNWWMSKRAYLFDDVGIDGFKTDGGEMVWGKNTSFSDGRSGREMRNAYPNAYIKSYNDFSANKTGTGMTFSRSGTTGIQKSGAFWAGDQDSSFSAFRDAMHAGISAGLSGVPFWGWDLAGFTGTFPSAELYKRSTMMAAFAPIMQFHSEKANPSVSEERSPWNVQQRTSDTSIIQHFRYYVNTRMNLLPYIFSEAKRCSSDGTPLMRAMFLDFPEDETTYTLNEQYMFGRNILVAPVVYEGQTVKQVYLPEGEWIDFFHNALTGGGRYKSYYCSADSIPVYVRNGSILPLNLNEDYEIGGSIGNDVENYVNLSFRIYPSGTNSYTLYHDDGSSMTVASSEDFSGGRISVSVPAYSEQVTVQVFSSAPDQVSVNGSTLVGVNSLNAFKQSASGYYYSAEEKLTYIKLPAASVVRNIVLNGVHKAPYEAEHADLTNVSTNTNHTGYIGEGFVDGFAEIGDAIEFTVYAEQPGATTLSLRYSAGTEPAMRSISVNNGTSVSLNLPRTTNWDTWGIASVTLSLLQGKNTVRVVYNSSDFAGINADCLYVSQ